MDFHSLARRDLQAMCKKNKIPANLTNAAMADALQSLKSIEWVEEIKQNLMPQSETIEQHGSPLPRSRRVSAISSDISGFSMGELNDKEEEMKKEALIEANQTPATAVRRSQRIQSAMSTKTRARTSTATPGTATCTAGTRTRRGKKEEAPAEAVDAALVETPAPQRGRKFSVETPDHGVVARSSACPTRQSTRTRRGKKEEAPAEAVDAVVVETPAPQRGRKMALETPAHGLVARSSARPTRQSTRRLAESMKGTRVTRTLTKLALDPDDDKEAETVAEKVEAKNEETAVELKENIISDTAPEQEHEARTDVFELGGATEPKSTDKLEVEEAAEVVDLVKEDEVVSDEKLNLLEPNAGKIDVFELGGATEPKSTDKLEVEEAAEDVDLGKEHELVSGEKVNLVEPNAEQIEIPQEKYTDTDESEGSTQEELNSKLSEKKEILTEKVEEAVEEQLNSNVSEKEKVASLLCDEHKDDVSVEKLLEEASLLVASLLSDRNAAPISEEGQVAPEKDDSEVNQTILVDSPIMGLVQENNSDLQNAPSSDITLDAQDAPSGLCLSSPIRAPADEGVEKMLDSVVRHFANARLSSDEMIDASVVQKEVTDKVSSDDAPELVQNENVDKERRGVDLKSMSLRKLKALYKDRLNEVNSKTVVEDEKRLPLGKLDENLLV